MPGLSYDDSGSLAAYFGLTCLSLVLFPTTIVSVRRGLSGSHGLSAKKQECPCVDCQRKNEEIVGFRKRDGKGVRRFGFSKRTTLLILGWTLAFGLAYLIYQAPVSGVTIYNPFEILGIQDSATEKQIKKHFKKLSLKFHPDKIRLKGNETQEAADAKFVELTKAYKSLTDEAIRENLRLYGNPDGVQSREEKIAIPKWVVEGKNGIWVLAVYGLGLGGGIPFLVGRWWFSQKQITKDGALNTTAEFFFHELFEDITFAQLISLLACALEFRVLLGLPGGRGSSGVLADPEVRDALGNVVKEKKMAKKERKFKASQTEDLEKVVRKKAEELGLGDVFAQQDFVSTAASRRAVALLWSQILRCDEISQDLKDERTRILLALPKILNSMLNISLAHHWLSTTTLIMSLSSRLVQATPLKDAPIAQLPGLDINTAAQAGRADEKLKGGDWQRYLTDMNDDAKEELRKAFGLSIEGDDVKAALKRIPVLEVSNVSFKVDGERNVTPGSFVNLVYEVRLADGTLPIPKPSSEKLEVPNAKDEDESSSDGEVSEAEKTTVLGIAGTEQVKGAVDDKETTKLEEIAFAHAPRWPAHRKPHWWVMIGDPTVNRVVVQPQRITDIPSEPNAKPKQFKMQFQAPPEANEYRFEAYWISDTYVGVDVMKPVSLKVEPLSEDVNDSDDDISDPEEDTLAGQLASMRGQKVKRVPEGEEDDEDEESSDEDGPVGNAVDSSDSDSD